MRLTEQVLRLEFLRVRNKTNITFDVFKSTWLNFAEKVGTIESNNNLTAKNTKSSAKGYYQFTDDSLKTGYNRLHRYIGKVERLPIVEQDLDTQTALFIANAAQQQGSDEYIVKMLNGINPIENQKKLYGIFHHTKPDKPTLELMDRVFRTCW